MRVKTKLSWHKWALVSSVLLGCALSVSAAEFTVQTLHFSGKTAQGKAVGKTDIAIAYVQPKQSADAAQLALAANINDRLFIAQFGVMAPRQPPASVGAAQGIAIEGLASQSFSVRRNDGRILTLLFDNEGCGAYCEGYLQAFNFDAASGQLVSLDGLFSKAGLRELSNRISQRKVSAYRAQLAELDKALKAAQKKPDKALLQDLDERIEFNRTCLNESRAAQTATNDTQDLKYYRLELKATAFSLTAGRCSNHAMRALDDVDQITLNVPYADLTPFLSAYGRALLLGDAQAPAVQPSNWPFGALLRGSIGANTPITMLLEKDASNAINGSYFYDKFGKPIQLSGSQSGQTLELTESVEGAPENASKASMRLNISGVTLKGVWSNAARNKQLELRLAP